MAADDPTDSGEASGGGKGIVLLGAMVPIVGVLLGLGYELLHAAGLAALAVLGVWAWEKATLGWRAITVIFLGSAIYFGGAWKPVDPPPPLLRYRIDTIADGAAAFSSPELQRVRDAVHTVATRYPDIEEVSEVDSSDLGELVLTVQTRSGQGDVGAEEARVPYLSVRHAKRLSPGVVSAFGGGRLAARDAVGAPADRAAQLALTLVLLEYSGRCLDADRFVDATLSAREAYDTWAGLPDAPEILPDIVDVWVSAFAGVDGAAGAASVTDRVTIHGGAPNYPLIDTLIPLLMAAGLEGEAKQLLILCQKKRGSPQDVRRLAEVYLNEGGTGGLASAKVVLDGKLDLLRAKDLVQLADLFATRDDRDFACVLFNHAVASISDGSLRHRFRDPATGVQEMMADLGCPD